MAPAPSSPLAEVKPIVVLYSMYHLYDRPRMCPARDNWDIQAWALDHPGFFCFSDSMLASSQQSGELITVLTGVGETLNAGPLGPTYVDAILHQVKSRQKAWEADWLDDPRE